LNNIYTTIKAHYDLLEYCKSLGWQINTSVVPYRCLSPFRKETQPSFCIYPETQTWTDFGDHTGGDIIALVSRLQNVSQGIACEILAFEADLEFSKLSPEEKEAHQAENAERMLCEEIMTSAAWYYHTKLKQGKFSYLWNTYFVEAKGISDEMIEKFALGFADGGLYSFLSLIYPDKDLIKTGLFRITRTGLVDYFVGRMVYPYWFRGRVVYFIAREFEGVTPKNKYEYHEKEIEGKKVLDEPIKFKKLRIHSEKNSYISKTVKNDWLYGLDSIKNSETIIITEGVADCISAIQCGYSCISPVTTIFRKHDHDQLIKYCKQAKQVIICNDVEDNDSGAIGAGKTGTVLACAGLEVSVATLPKDSWSGKIDVNDYVRDSGPEAFSDVLDAAQGIINYLLDRITDKEKANNLSKALQPILAICTTYDRVRKDAAFSAIKNKMGIGKDVLKGAMAETKVKNVKPEIRSMSLKIDQNGDPMDSDGNLALIFRNHPEISGTLGYNLRDTREYILQKNAFANTGNFPLQLKDTHISNAMIWLQDSMGILSRRTRAVREAITEACRNPEINKTFDPINEWLENLKPWDGLKRIESLFIDHLGVENTMLHKEYGRCFCISLIARVKEPGCKVDTVPILISKQGTLKSTFFRNLVPDEKYFLDNKINFATKDGLMMLHGPWIVEMSELSSIRSMDVNAIKTVLASQSDVYRRPYGVATEEHPRTCIIVGTSNDDQILKDLTGNRRYWPMLTNKRVDIKRVLKERDQIMAEALHEYKAGVPWFLSYQIEEMREGEAYCYMEDNSDIDILADYLSKPLSDFEGMKLLNPGIEYDRMFNSPTERAFITTLEISKITDLMTKSGAQKSRILRALGWERKQTYDKIKGKSIRIYYNSAVLKADEVLKIFSMTGKSVQEDKIETNYNSFN